MSVSLSLLASTGVLVLGMLVAGCTPGNDTRNSADTAITGSGKMDASLRRALREADASADTTHNVLLGVADETAVDADAFMKLQQDLRTAGLTVRTISGSVVTVRGSRSAIEAAAADNRIASLQLSAKRSF